MKLSVVIPCYNEQSTIETVVEAVRAAPVEDPPPRKEPAVEGPAEIGFKQLQARAKQAKLDRDALRRDLLTFRMQHAGTPEALRAGTLLAHLPSPLDRVNDPKFLPSFSAMTGSRRN